LTATSITTATSVRMSTANATARASVDAPAGLAPGEPRVAAEPRGSVEPRRSARSRERPSTRPQVGLVPALPGSPLREPREAAGEHPFLRMVTGSGKVVVLLIRSYGQRTLGGVPWPHRRPPSPGTLGPLTRSSGSSTSSPVGPSARSWPSSPLRPEPPVDGSVRGCPESRLDRLRTAAPGEQREPEASDASGPSTPRSPAGERI
jgi:hypothetical protein